MNLVDPSGEYGVAGAIAGAIVGAFSTFIDPCGGFKFQGWKNLFFNTAGGAAFGAIGANFSSHTIGGLVGGLGASFLSGLVNYATASPCQKEPSCE